MPIDLEIKFDDKSGIVNLEAVARKFPKVVAGALLKIGERIMTRSKQEFVPVDDSPLKNSGKVSGITVRGDVISVRLSYNTVYALAVHEHLSDHSPPSWKAAEAAGRPVKFSPTGHGPKYLERPVLEAAKTFPQDFAAELRAARGLLP